MRFSSRYRLLLVVGAYMGATVAAPTRFSEAQLAQQQRMTDCAAEAKRQSLRGEARPAFMKTCLSGGQVTVEVGGEIGTAPARPRAAKPDAGCTDTHCDGR